MYRYFSKSMLIKSSIKLSLGIALLLLINNCSLDKAALKPPPDHPIQLRVENHSPTVIDVIQAKPCGSDPKQYKPQITGVKPKERIMLEIYEDCVDLIALDGFGNIMDELAALRLNSNITWKIH